MHVGCPVSIPSARYTDKADGLDWKDSVASTATEDARAAIALRHVTNQIGTAPRYGRRTNTILLTMSVPKKRKKPAPFGTGVVINANTIRRSGFR
ncbi:hypothetical protein ACS15_3357 [Ralstonia insidiosa]|uniref:Uncharacterized protein n=1 Tax=Ralstonia insidiosa TaxID=190721 RepID=A0AAC9BHB6_9RALS|nr:hypothetical protein ACS15_3357 [Ralstonia insidiosa]